MSTPRRKSSLGTSRRVPQKYIPYRADDYQRGKRTGVVVDYIEHNSDEFEPFEQLMNQADQRTPPRVQGVRKRRVQKTPVVQPEEIIDDDNGEMSMELDESVRNSPAAYFTNARSARITSSVQRVGSSSRPVQRVSDVDFDQVPSPRPSTAFNRSSFARTRSPGPSRLSRSTAAVDEEEDQPEQDDIDGELGGLDFHNDGFDDDDDDDDGVSHEVVESSLSHSNKPESLRRRPTFTAIEEEDEDEIAQVEEDMDPRISPELNSRRGGYQEKPVQDVHDVSLEDNMGPSPEPDMQVDEEHEEGSAQRKHGRGHETNGRHISESEELSNKRARTESEAPQEPKRRRGRPRKENRVQVLTDVTPDKNARGLRRGMRTRYAPLEWWRLEKVVYGRRESGTCLVPTIKEILRVPKEDPQPLGAKKRKRSTRSQSKAKSVEVEASMVFNPEEGWDDETDPSGVVIDYEDGVELTRRLACTAKMITPKPAASNEFYFQKVFGDGDFIAAGQLIIPPTKQKPTKGTKDNTFVFYVIEGAVNCKIHETSFIISTGGMFVVPRGNLYCIQNISDRDAKLFFAQARKILVDDIDEEMSRRSTSVKLQRGQSGGPAPRSSTARASSEVSKGPSYRAPPTKKAAPVKA